jgi:CheY-like chemotaxis protein
LNPPDGIFIYLRDRAMNEQATAFCESLRSDQNLRNVPVIVSGALAPRDIYPALQEAGAAGYLYEPFTPRALLAARDAAFRGETYCP